MRQAVGADRDKIAPKADLAALEARLKAELETGLASVRADLETGLAALETRLTTRFFGGLLAMGSLNVAAVAALKLFA